LTINVKSFFLKLLYVGRNLMISISTEQRRWHRLVERACVTHGYISLYWCRCPCMRERKGTRLPNGHVCDVRLCLICTHVR